MQGLHNVESFPVDIYKRTLYSQVSPVQSELHAPTELNTNFAS